MLYVSRLFLPNPEKLPIVTLRYPLLLHVGMSMLSIGASNPLSRFQGRETPSRKELLVLCTYREQGVGGSVKNYGNWGISFSHRVPRNEKNFF